MFKLLCIPNSTVFTLAIVLSDKLRASRNDYRTLWSRSETAMEALFSFIQNFLWSKSKSSYWEKRKNLVSVFLLLAYDRWGISVPLSFKSCIWWLVDCPLSEGNQAANPKFERHNGKNTKSTFFFKSVKNWCGQLTWKLNEAISSKVWIKSKQIKINDVFDFFTSKA